MNTYQFKTNIMCASCIAKVSPVLNETFGETNWKVDIKDPRKIITVSAADARPEEVIKAIEKAGYQAGELKGV